MNHLTSSQIYPETLWEVPTPGFGTTESFNPRRRKLCAAAVVQQIYIEVCREFVTGFIEPPLCAGVSGSHIFVACVCFLSLCLAEIPVNELVTCISRLVPRYFCLPTVSYLLLRLLSFFFLHSAHVFFFHGFVCLHSQWMEITDSGRCSQEQGCSPPFFVLSLSLFFSLKCRRLGMLWVSKLASVLGVPGE